MDIYQISLILIPPIFAGIGFLCKYVIDNRTSYLKKINKAKLDDVQFKLKNFYYPIHNNLLRENIIWNKILAFYNSRNDGIENLRNKLFWSLDQEMLDIHLENQRIIKENIVEINPDELLSHSLMRYDEHVTIYNIIRKVDTNRPDDMVDVNWPRAFGSDYPSEIVDLVETQVKLLKEKQNYLIYLDV